MELRPKRGIQLLSWALLALFVACMLAWLTPLGLLFMLLSLLAGVMVVLSYTRVRVDVQINVTDTSGKA